MGAVRKKKGKISSVKRGNQKRTKLIKQGKLKVSRNKRAANITRNPRKVNREQKKAEENNIDAEESEDDMVDMVETDDLAFLKKSVTDKSYSMLKRLRYSSSGDKNKPRSKKKETPVGRLYEEEYENQLDAAGKDIKPSKELLPVKTIDGIIQRRKMEVVEKVPEEEEEKEEENDEEMDEDLEEDSEPEVDDRIDLTEPVSAAKLLAIREAQLKRFRISIGALSSGVLEDPRGKLGNLKKLLAYMSEPQSAEVALTVPRLAAVSLCEVFCDILPEYSIRDSTELDGVKLRKETRELQSEEQGLLLYYRKYLTFLEKMLKPLNSKDKSKVPETKLRLAIVALKCLGMMLESRPSFNYSLNIVRLMVPMVDHRTSTEARDVTVKSLTAVLRQDKRGDLSLEITRRVNALIKARSTVRPDCLKLLLNLRIKDIDLDSALKLETKSKRLENKKHKILHANSKREKKRAKRMEELNKELLETKAEESKQDKLKKFTETIKLVFTIYFRVLKSEPNPSLLAVTLEGLSKFAHSINIEMYGDLVNTLDKMLQLNDLPLNLKILCVKTLLAVLSGHGQFLTIDPSRFHTQLYRCLISLCKLNSNDELKETIQPLNTIICAKRHSISHNRLLAFLKRLATISLYQEQNAILAYLQLIRSALQCNQGIDVLLETETRAGKYLPELDEPEYCAAHSTSIFELTYLQRHFHPIVSNLSQHIINGASVTDDSLAQVLKNTSPDSLFNDFDAKEGNFKPPIPYPKLQAKQRLHFSINTIRDNELRYKAELLTSDNITEVNYFKEFNTK